MAVPGSEMAAVNSASCIGVGSPCEHPEVALIVVIDSEGSRVVSRLWVGCVRGLGRGGTLGRPPGFLLASEGRVVLRWL